MISVLFHGDVLNPVVVNLQNPVCCFMFRSNLSPRLQCSSVFNE